MQPEPEGRNLQAAPSECAPEHPNLISRARHELEGRRSCPGGEDGVDDVLGIPAVFLLIRVVDQALEVGVSLGARSHPSRRRRTGSDPRGVAAWRGTSRTCALSRTGRRGRRRAGPPRSYSGFPTCRRIEATRPPARPSPQCCRAPPSPTRSSIQLLSDRASRSGPGLDEQSSDLRLWDFTRGRAETLLTCCRWYQALSGNSGGHGGALRRSALPTGYPTLISRCRGRRCSPLRLASRTGFRTSLGWAR
jgi:hypothetical protein